MYLAYPAPDDEEHVTAFATRKGAEEHVHKFLPTDRFKEGAFACKAEIVETEVGD